MGGSGGCCCYGGKRDGGRGKWAAVMRKREMDGEDWVWREKH